jgi:uncharacterized integral membrane protein
MGGTLFWLLLWLVVVTVFALSNLTTETIRFWQWPVYTGPLGMIVVGAGVLGAVLTYVGSLQHHVRQARQIRTLQGTIHEHEAKQTPSALGGGPSVTPMRSGPTEETRRLP